MSKQIKRSDKYDFFKGTVNNKNSKKTPKENFKLAFKYIKIAFYVFLLGISLTGCIQSIAIKSSSTTGSGIEFYTNENDIAPFVTTYKITDNINRPVLDEYGNNIRDEKGNLVYEQQLIKDTKSNYLVTDDDGTITNLRNQIEIQHEGKDNLYGQYDNYSSSLRILNSDGKFISNTLNISKSSEGGQLIRGTNKEKDFLFLNSSMLSNINDSTSLSYDYANKILEIPIFIQKLPTAIPDKDELKNWENARTGGKFQAFRLGAETPVKINDKGQYLKIDGTPLDVSLAEDRAEIDSFEYSFEFEKIILEVDLNSFASEKFSRDYLQSLVNIIMQFNQFNALDKLPSVSIDSENELSSITEKRLNNLNTLKSQNFLDNPIVETPKMFSANESKVFDSNELTNTSNFIENMNITNQRYSNNMRIAILNYQSNMNELLTKSGYSISKLNLTGENPDSWPTSNPFELNFGEGNSHVYNFLSNGSLVGQKPIVTWGDAWGLGPFYGFVVYPMSFLVNSLVGSLPPSLGGGVALLSIVISVILARMLTLLLTYKSVFAQAKQQTLAPKKAKIDAKYIAYKGNKQMEQKKRQETSELYKKNNINMLTPLLSTLVSMPIFLAMWRIIQGIPFIKSTSLWGINFSQTSWRELFAGEWQYLILIILAVVVQAGSQLLPRYLNKKRMKERSNIAEKAAMKKANRTQNIIMAMFILMAVIFEAGVQIYWIVGGIWTMLQTLMIHHIQKTKFFREKLIKYV